MAEPVAGAAGNLAKGFDAANGSSMVIHLTAASLEGLIRARKHSEKISVQKGVDPKKTVFGRT